MRRETERERARGSERGSESEGASGVRGEGEESWDSKKEIKRWDVYLHGAAENYICHFWVDLEEADAAVAVAGNGLNEGSLSRARNPVEEIRSPVRDAVGFVE